MIPFIEKHIRDISGREPLFIKLPSKQIRRSDVSTISFLVNVLTDKGELPFAIVKIPRDQKNPYSIETLRLEHNNLSFLSGRIKEGLKGSIPSIIFLKEIENCLVLAESRIKGSEMSSTILSSPQILETFLKNLDAASGWLISFLSSFEKKTCSLPGTVSLIIEEYSSLFPKRDKKIFSRSFELLEHFSNTLADKDTPIVPQHGDYHADNIFMENGNISGVIDWEDFSTEEHPPCFDLIHFIYTYLEALYGAFLNMGSLELTRSLQINEPFYNRIDAAIRSFCKDAGIDHELMELFIPLYLLKSLSAAGDPRKQAKTAIKKLELMFMFSPRSIKGLSGYMAYVNYLNLEKRYKDSGEADQAALCRKMMNDIEST